MEGGKTHEQPLLKCSVLDSCALLTENTNYLCCARVQNKNNRVVIHTPKYSENMQDFFCIILVTGVLGKITVQLFEI